MRIDKYLVLNNYFKTRNKAQIAILAKSVKVNGKIIDKTSYDIDGNVDIEIKMIDELKYVSRGGLKLEGAIKAFDLDFNNKVVLRFETCDRWWRGRSAENERSGQTYF